MARRTRHYRAAKKEIEFKPIASNGIFINNKQKPYILLALISILIFIFIDGFIFGWLLKENTSRRG